MPPPLVAGVGYAMTDTGYEVTQEYYVRLLVRGTPRGDLAAHKAQPHTNHLKACQLTPLVWSIIGKKKPMTRR